MLFTDPLETHFRCQTSYVFSGLARGRRSCSSLSCAGCATGTTGSAPATTDPTAPSMGDSSHEKSGEKNMKFGSEDEWWKFRSSANKNGNRWGLNHENKLDLALQYGERWEFKIEKLWKIGFSPTWGEMGISASKMMGFICVYISDRVFAKNWEKWDLQQWPSASGRPGWEELFEKLLNSIGFMVYGITN